MAQNDIQITTTPPLPGLTLVQGINGALQSLATDFAGPVDPAAIDGVGPYCTWADTGNGLLKRRNAAGTDWVIEGELFQRTARQNGDGTQNFNVASLNGGQLAGFRNKILNGAFQINQRTYVSGTATTAGQYTFDRWKVTGAAGIAFSTVNNKTTVTIPAGQTLQQVIEGINLQSGDYVLSWEGTAQGRIGAGAYGASGQVIASITGGVNTTIEFNAGTVANVQLELGTVATPFENRPFEIELGMCSRYYFVGTTGGVSNGPSGATVQRIYCQYRTLMRAIPTVSLAPVSGSASTPVVTTTYLTGVLIGFSSTGIGQDIVVSVRAESEL